MPEQNSPNFLDALMDSEGMDTNHLMTMLEGMSGGGFGGGTSDGWSVGASSSSTTPRDILRPSDEDVVAEKSRLNQLIGDSNKLYQDTYKDYRDWTADRDKSIRESNARQLGLSPGSSRLQQSAGAAFGNSVPLLASGGNAMPAPPMPPPMYDPSKEQKYISPTYAPVLNDSKAQSVRMSKRKAMNFGGGGPKSDSNDFVSLRIDQNKFNSGENEQTIKTGKIGEGVHERGRTSTIIAASQRQYEEFTGGIKQNFGPNSEALNLGNFKTPSSVTTAINNAPDAGAIRQKYAGIFLVPPDNAINHQDGQKMDIGAHFGTTLSMAIDAGKSYYDSTTLTDEQKKPYRDLIRLYETLKDYLEEDPDTPGLWRVRPSRLQNVRELTLETGQKVTASTYTVFGATSTIAQLYQTADADVPDSFAALLSNNEDIDRGENGTTIVLHRDDDNNVYLYAGQDSTGAHVHKPLSPDAISLLNSVGPLRKYYNWGFADKIRGTIEDAAVQYLKANPNLVNDVIDSLGLSESDNRKTHAEFSYQLGATLTGYIFHGNGDNNSTTPWGSAINQKMPLFNPMP